MNKYLFYVSTWPWRPWKTNVTTTVLISERTITGYLLDWTGMEWNGMERNGMERNGTEGNRTECCPIVLELDSEILLWAVHVFRLQNDLFLWQLSKAKIYVQLCFRWQQIIWLQIIMTTLIHFYMFLRNV